MGGPGTAVSNAWGLGSLSCHASRVSEAFAWAVIIAFAVIYFVSIVRSAFIEPEPFSTSAQPKACQLQPETEFRIGSSSLQESSTKV